MARLARCVLRCMLGILTQASLHSRGARPQRRVGHWALAAVPLVPDAGFAPLPAFAYAGNGTLAAGPSSAFFAGLHRSPRLPWAPAPPPGLGHSWLEPCLLHRALGGGSPPFAGPMGLVAQSLARLSLIHI
eukprot:5175185-Alexandrium_andersonii.AAC.1